MNTQLKFSVIRSVVALLWVAASSFSMAEDSQKSESQAAFHLKGNAFGKDDQISLTITNSSPEEHDYLIEFGEVSVVGLVHRDSKQGLRVRMQTVLSGGPLKRVAASKGNLVTGGQMMRLEFKIPEEHKNAKIDFVEIDLHLCRTPITTNQVVLSSAKLQMPVKQVATQ